MITVYYAQEGATHELTINGHAGYAECGQDIVCAGVSAIGYALLGYIERCEDDVEEMDGPIVECGSIYVCCTGNPNITAAFHMAVCGLEQIADAYPDHVEIQIVPQGE